ncbi:AAA family ATPase [Rhizobium laguerreae]|uniref:AAA family ATPase n=1 Tax=Rhizobium laguerreae TaxID=1076926 RepID=UPI001C8FF63D|nr:AAA family ATPase [Rhizobium laguerreae]MBY3168696.1 AAA family ATPase [Rhizobium laguerreae]
MGAGPLLIGISGLSGAGKSTATTMLAALSGGKSVYVGQVVLDEIKALGLEQTRENERRVRLDIREREGGAGLLRRKRNEILSALANGQSVFVDAILSPDEWFELEMMHKVGTRLLIMDADFETRAARLTARNTRPFSRDDLIRRDDTEQAALRIEDLDKDASIRIENIGPLDHLERCLASFLHNIELPRLA